MRNKAALYNPARKHTLNIVGFDLRLKWIRAKIRDIDYTRGKIHFTCDFGGVLIALCREEQVHSENISCSFRKKRTYCDFDPSRNVEGRYNWVQLS